LKGPAISWRRKKTAKRKMFPH